MFAILQLLLLLMTKALPTEGASIKVVSTITGPQSHDIAVRDPRAHTSCSSILLNDLPANSRNRWSNEVLSPFDTCSLCVIQYKDCFWYGRSWIPSRNPDGVSISLSFVSSSFLSTFPTTVPPLSSLERTFCAQSGILASSSLVEFRIVGVSASMSSFSLSFDSIASSTHSVLLSSSIASSRQVSGRCDKLEFPYCAHCSIEKAASRQVLIGVPDFGPSSILVRSRRPLFLAHALATAKYSLEYEDTFLSVL
mmetsp:Transcript_141/g.368  ORF Transcript_141/g.368 Transcript_141/m.368 type:complete len:252 (-) Transcript_141:1021-1776(-)